MENNSAIKTFSYSVGEFPHRIESVVALLGDDIVISVGGGHKHHIGAVAVADFQADNALQHEDEDAPMVMVIPGHKEGEIVAEAVRRLSQKFHCCVVVSAGLHIDHAEAHDIALLVDNFFSLIEKIELNLEDKLTDGAGD